MRGYDLEGRRVVYAIWGGLCITFLEPKVVPDPVERSAFGCWCHFGLPIHKPPEMAYKTSPLSVIMPWHDSDEVAAVTACYSDTVDML